MIVLFGIRMGRNYTDKCMYEHAKKKPTVFNTGTLSWCNRHEASDHKKMFDAISK